MPKQLNQAHITISALKAGSDKLMVDRGQTVEWLNIHTDVPKSKFNLQIKDQLGNIVIEKKVDTGETNRFGERISLPMTDSYYEAVVTGVENAKVIDCFLD